MANSAWKRNVPRKSTSLATNCVMGKLISPPMPTVTKMPRGTMTSRPARNAGSLPEASNTASNWPLSALYLSSNSGWVLRLMVSSAPISLAHFKGRSAMSAATMRAAPARRKAPMSSDPMGPQPVTKTCLPSTPPAR